MFPYRNHLYSQSSTKISPFIFRAEAPENAEAAQDAVRDEKILRRSLKKLIKDFSDSNTDFDAHKIQQGRDLITQIDKALEAKRFQSDAFENFRRDLRVMRKAVESILRAESKDQYHYEAQFLQKRNESLFLKGEDDLRKSLSEIETDLEFEDEKDAALQKINQAKQEIARRRNAIEQANKLFAEMIAEGKGNLPDAVVNLHLGDSIDTYQEYSDFQILLEKNKSNPSLLRFGAKAAKLAEQIEKGEFTGLVRNILFSNPKLIDALSAKLGITQEMCDKIMNQFEIGVSLDSGRNIYNLEFLKIYLIQTVKNPGENTNYEKSLEKSILKYNEKRAPGAQLTPEQAVMEIEKCADYFKHEFDRLAPSLAQQFNLPEEKVRLFSQHFDFSDFLHGKQALSNLQHEMLQETKELADLPPDKMAQRMQELTAKYGEEYPKFLQLALATSPTLSFLRNPVSIAALKGVAVTGSIGIWSRIIDAVQGDKTVKEKAYDAASTVLDTGKYFIPFVGNYWDFEDSYHSFEKGEKMAGTLSAVSGTVGLTMDVISLFPLVGTALGQAGKFGFKSLVRGALKVLPHASHLRKIEALGKVAAEGGSLLSRGADKLVDVANSLRTMKPAQLMDLVLKPAEKAFKHLDDVSLHIEKIPYIGHVFKPVFYLIRETIQGMYNLLTLKMLKKSPVAAANGAGDAARSEEHAPEGGDKDKSPAPETSNNGNTEEVIFTPPPELPDLPNPSGSDRSPTNPNKTSAPASKSKNSPLITRVSDAILSVYDRFSSSKISKERNMGRDLTEKTGISCRLENKSKKEDDTLPADYHFSAENIAKVRDGINALDESVKQMMRDNNIELVISSEGTFYRDTVVSLDPRAIYLPINAKTDLIPTAVMDLIQKIRVQQKLGTLPFKATLDPKIENTDDFLGDMSAGRGLMDVLSHIPESDAKLLKELGVEINITTGPNRYSHAVKSPTIYLSAKESSEVISRFISGTVDYLKINHQLKDFYKTEGVHIQLDTDGFLKGQNTPEKFEDYSKNTLEELPSRVAALGLGFELLPPVVRQKLKKQKIDMILVETDYTYPILGKIFYLNVKNKSPEEIQHQIEKLLYAYENKVKDRDLDSVPDHPYGKIKRDESLPPIDRYINPLRARTGLNNIGRWSNFDYPPEISRHLPKIAQILSELPAELKNWLNNGGKKFVMIGDENQLGSSLEIDYRSDPQQIRNLLESLDAQRRVSQAIPLIQKSSGIENIIFWNNHIFSSDVSKHLLEVQKVLNDLPVEIKNWLNRDKRRIVLGAKNQITHTDEGQTVLEINISGKPEDIDAFLISFTGQRIVSEHLPELQKNTGIKNITYWNDKILPADIGTQFPHLQQTLKDLPEAIKQALNSEKYRIVVGTENKLSVHTDGKHSIEINALANQADIEAFIKTSVQNNG